MTDNNDNIDIAVSDRIEPVDLQVEMQRSYLDYAMSVIVSRALPDVRDGLKPVHRRVLYAMYDGGYRPDRSYNKSARVVGEVMGNYHPHGDSAIYDTLVRLTQPWILRYPLVDGQGNFGSPGNDGAAASRYTECRMAPLAMEMLRDIDEETVDFVPNYDGKNMEPTVLPSRFPNLLVNGSAGIAVGMATNIPPHNLREVASAVEWALDNPEADRETTLAAVMERVPGPDFPTRGVIVGRRGVDDAYRTGRGLITMRGVVEVEEDARGRTVLRVTELPYQVNPDNLITKIAELAEGGKVTGLADVIDQSAGGKLRIDIVLKKDAVAQVVLNQLYRHTQLQETFGANMVALVDGVPRTLSLDLFIRHWITHQLEVIRRRTAYRLRKAEERAHILRGLLAAIDRIDEVIALIRASSSAAAAQEGLQELLSIDELQARAILDMQLRKLAALERNELQSEYDALMTAIADYQDILANEARQRGIVREELGEIVARYGDERRTQLASAEDEVVEEDLIAEQDIVVTITRGGYAKRTRADAYRAQRRGGKGVKGAALRQDDVVEHFFVTTTHHWLLFFTNKGRVYRTKGYRLPELGRDARGQHVANLLALLPDEQICQVLAIKDYEQSAYLVLATREGQVKKTRLLQYDTNRSGGVIAIALKEDDEVISAALVEPTDELMLVSRKGMSVRFAVNDDTVRPMGRAAAGVIGMKFRSGDNLLAMQVVRPGASLVTVTSGGYGKRTPLNEWNTKGRATLGVRAMRLVDARGDLIAAVVVEPEDEVFAIASNGVVIRTRVAEVRETGRDTMGVMLMGVGDAEVVAVARGEAAADDDDLGAEDADGHVTDEGEVTEVASAASVEAGAGAVDVVADSGDSLTTGDTAGDTSSDHAEQE